MLPPNEPRRLIVIILIYNTPAGLMLLVWALGASTPMHIPNYLVLWTLRAREQLVEVSGCFGHKV